MRVEIYYLHSCPVILVKIQISHNVAVTALGEQFKLAYGLMP
jgi:hypothetical protein